MNELLKGKVAIITGGTRGIGKAIAQKFSEHGADIILTYKNNYSAKQLSLIKSSLSRGNNKIMAYQVDVSSYDQCEQFVNSVLKEFRKVDICVNNAGISKDVTLSRTTPTIWHDIMVNNLYSVFNMTKLVVRSMVKAKGGSSINMSSVVGVYGNAWQTSYAASKAGIIGFTKSVAKELGSKQIRCNAIAPGFIETDMTKALIEAGISKDFKKNISLGRYGQPGDVAGLALFLASNESAYITGQVICLDGGIGK